MILGSARVSAWLCPFGKPVEVILAAGCAGRVLGLGVVARLDRGPGVIGDCGAGLRTGGDQRGGCAAALAGRRKRGAV